MRVISLCSGYGGIELGLDLLFDAELAAVAEIDPGACKILKHRFPEIPNLGNIAEIDWTGYSGIDLLTAGFPCQDVSAAGTRAGLRAGTRTGVWYQVDRAISELKPKMVILENVRGLLSAGADSDMESCPYCVGDESGVHALRALGAVLGDLADLGYDAIWSTVSAAAAGAPHRRERVFILAYPDGSTEPASAVEAGSGLVAAVQGGEEPRSSLDREHAAAADTAVPGRARRGRIREQVRAPGDAAHDGAPELERRRSAAADSGLPARPEGLPDGTAAAGGGGIAALDAASDGWRDDPVLQCWFRTEEPEPGDYVLDEWGFPVEAPADAGGERLPQLAGESSGEEAWPLAGYELADHRGERPDRNRGAAADAIGERWHGRSFVTLRPETLRAAAAGLGARLDAHPDSRGREGSPEPDGWPDEPGFEAPFGDDADGRGPADADAELAGLEGIAVECVGGASVPATDGEQNWGQYAGAIARWERVTGRSAPRPAEPSSVGSMRLSPRFVEWMMGLPDGWVTQVPKLNRTEQLKALGNGVVPQQLALAISQLLSQLAGIRSEHLAPGSDRLLPTPNTMDSMEPKTPEQIMAHRSSGKGGDANLREVMLYELEERLPTPRAARGGSGSETMLAFGATRSDANRPQGELLL